ncbi:hypothetical protein AGABI2DRAFT_72723, partial [Agaricus bisporus var. bisporus H97]|uniref:hypothetical protein n=1 Tax=Agaricus bisporus var. bisporus (strain H97 / ATCC MYA-4626 / FGSC 10389) TaxID=936046 RepID=UPI00029F7B92
MVTNSLLLLAPSYFQENYRPPRVSDRVIASQTIADYGLNTEQKRAFSIVANHSTSVAPKQLLMYLGGMGGTGKTQVLRALKAFFASRGQGHRLVATAPTGSTSSLLGGSTYHYLLGINQRKSDNDSNLRSLSLSVARDRIRGIDYIFLDEVSMVACHELCSISKKLAEINNIHDLPFGGVNFIFSGDFAQLPPVSSNPLYGQMPS